MFKNMKIGVRLGMSFGLLILLLLSMGLFGMNRMGLLAELTSRLYEHPLMVSNAVIQANLNIVKIQNAMKDVLIVEDLARIGGIMSDIGKGLKNLKTRTLDRNGTILERIEGEVELNDVDENGQPRTGPVLVLCSIEEGTQLKLAHPRAVTVCEPSAARYSAPIGSRQGVC